MRERQIGERVAQLRRERNLTRAEFGSLIGKSEQYVGRIERGASVIAVDVVSDICDATGASADYIIRGAADITALVEPLNGLSRGQIDVFLDMAADVIKFFNAKGGNGVLLKEALRRSRRRVI